MTRRKIITRTCVCLILGLVTTWAVAWGAALRGYQWSASPEMELYSPHGDDPRGLVTSERGWLAGRRRVITRATLSDELNAFHQAGLLMPDRPSAEVGRNWAMDDDQLFAYFDRRRSIHVAEYLFGWPFPALWLVSDARSPSYPDRIGGIPLPQSWNAPYTGSLEARALPYSPVWRGLLANTALYAALWTLPLIGIPLLRQRRRVRRGRCPSCGYDVQGVNVACPECGVTCGFGSRDG